MARYRCEKVLLVVLGIALSATPIGSDYIDITEKFGAEAVAKCNEKCPFQNRTVEGPFDLSCDADCSMQQCALGCSLWRQGLESSCQNSCNVQSETVFSRELYCVIGCNDALNTYYQTVRELIGVPPAPALVPDTLTATSLSLVWEAPKLAKLSYLLQWRYDDLPTWQYYNGSYSWDMLDVRDLRPYTKYQFRIAIFISGRAGLGEPMFSAASVSISTAPLGRPASPPRHLRATPPDAYRVAVTWEPGRFTNGPLIGYVIRIADAERGYSAVQDMVTPNSTFYMFQNLAPSRRYEVTVAMRNAEGEGPRARVSVTTPQANDGIPQQPILILGSERAVLAAPANDILTDPIELYSTEYNITGVAIDVTHDYLFISVSDNFVYRSCLSRKREPIPILTPTSISYKPLDLSVDWLNNHLYILGEVYYSKSGSEGVLYPSWEILRCDFDGKNQMVALSGFTTRPAHFEVDPYNGYLFYCLPGPSGGIYRLDLSHIGNGARQATPPQMVSRAGVAAGFAVDHAHNRILLPHTKQNNVIALSLDGQEQTPFRSNIQTSKFTSARSIAYANGLFYWTNGHEMLTEEYHAKTDSYYHNEYPIIFNFTKIEIKHVLVNLRSCQPIPMAVNPPISVQGVFGIDKVKVVWSPPHLLGHQGAGAWQKWEYTLQLISNATGEVIERKRINNTYITVTNLTDNSDYLLKVAAVTIAGTGPWSTEFTGRTLEDSEETRLSRLIFATPDGLIQTDLIADHAETLIHSSQLKNVEITDISFYHDKLYLVTNLSSVLWYNTTSRVLGALGGRGGVGGVGAVAVDWAGRKLYCSNPKQQLITRGDLDGGNMEPVAIVTVAKEMAIDSLQAYLYWNTGHAVEAARLNGENKMVYYPAQLFSGKQVMGIAVELESRWLYWLVRSSEGSELHRAPTAELYKEGTREVVVSVAGRAGAGAGAGGWALGVGGLCVSGGRALWAGAAGAVAAGAGAGGGPALLLPGATLVKHKPATHTPDNLIAIPSTINASSISVHGTWDNFNVSWQPETGVNIPGAKVYYDVSLLLPFGVKIERTVSEAYMSVSGRGAPPPASAVWVVVGARSAWGRGGAARRALRSPPAPPAQPQRTTLYCLTQSNGELSAIFRWSVPSPSNGDIRGYDTRCWLLQHTHNVSRPSACASVTLPPSRRQLELKDLLPNTTYFFQVRAFNDAGHGPYTEPINISSTTVNPIPKVMISSQEYLKIIDLDSLDSETVPKSTGIPIDYAVSIEENIVYWVNNLEEIFAARINGSGHYKLTSLTGPAFSLTLDWVSRSVFWSQLDGTEHAVYRADIGLSKPKITKVFTNKAAVYGLQVVPGTRTLYWYEETTHPGLGNLITANVDGTNIKPFFNGTLNDDCNCPEQPQIAKTFVIDQTQNEYELYWVDPWVHQIIATDMFGCKCRIVVDATEKKKHGFTPMSISVDSKYVYWFNSTEKNIYFTTKTKKSKITSVKASFGYKIFALDVANQPYPPRDCLYPNTDNLAPILISHSANNLTLELPIISIPEECSIFNYELPLTEYRILYQATSDSHCDRDTCQFISTTDTEVILTDLRPFTNYTVMVEVTNYYGRLHERKPLVGQPSIFQTAAEAPKKPRNLQVAPLSPEEARASWLGEEGTIYELHWSTDTETRKLVSLAHTANISGLTPSTTYSVWVRARSPHSLVQVDSTLVKLVTFANPPEIRLVNVTAFMISVTWVPPSEYGLKSYKVQFSEVTPFSATVWKTCLRNGHTYTANDLEPNSRYRFRLALQYVDSGPVYHWPKGDLFSFDTLAAVPGAAGALWVSAGAGGGGGGGGGGAGGARARWPPAPPRGSPVLYYLLWGRPMDGEKSSNGSHNATQKFANATTDEHEGLVLLHNTTETYWLIEPASLSGGYTVYVQAYNAAGGGALSPGAELRTATTTVKVWAAPLAAIVGGVFIAVLVYLYKSRYRQNKKCGGSRPDVELATLRQLPINMPNNLNYNAGMRTPTDAELASLPHIRREQITLSKFLGSGAFGEVFEGVARGLNGAAADTRVAVKTLRKGATQQEKTEFLQEAALMSNFKHEHILRLLGVCLDNDPHYIIMELMQGGDLLSYLRGKRADLYTPQSLTMLDLLNMCVDVTKGCRYLEEMHFVHRDLAARNCLVAKRENGQVIVKIGDFGLARDIYKNDYYRKEGEGLLPVRWMAVECLVDGVFSCQSDVWAWGVLCWEVMSLGAQPYPALTNRQVLAVVRSGGRPDPPHNCPPGFYDHLQRCWSYRPASRPTFKECLARVTELRDEAAAPPTHPLYLTILPDAAGVTNQLACADAVDNRTYLLRHNHLPAADAPYPGQVECSGVSTPKYLELLPDDEPLPSPPDFDGYEIPRPPSSFNSSWRHSIIGLPPNRLAKPPLYRTHSLRTNVRSPNATITPLRNGITKRASFCEGLMSERRSQL